MYSGWNLATTGRQQLNKAQPNSRDGIRAPTKLKTGKITGGSA